MKKICFGLAYLLTQGLLQSTELRPWTEVDLQLYPRFEYFYQHYHKINSSDGSKHRIGNDHFYTLGVYGSYDVWSVEAETTAATTHYRCFGFDNVRVTGRYRLWNDIVGDFASVMAGGTYIAAPQSAVDDIGSFHHGGNEGKLHLAIGKERTCGDTWASRTWGVLQYGFADEGKPWWEWTLAWEKNFNRTTYLEFFATGLYGLGREGIDLDCSFRGYGPIKHRSVDLGARVTRMTECYGIWYAEYAQRVYAYNFPQGANLFKICLIYPFSL